MTKYLENIFDINNPIECDGNKEIEPTCWINICPANACVWN